MVSIRSVVAGDEKLAHVAKASTRARRGSRKRQRQSIAKYHGSQLELLRGYDLDMGYACHRRWFTL
ncbi:hypothetical protein HAX54_021360 [Datura stramonium]|uniref:Uncharacterized protein n=1 Tax=Datura stramonium TaxID=4076 RepID=A0ABS8S3G4_DATST|nr:hypothetical protein [Datura stramonium]